MVISKPSSSTPYSSFSWRPDSPENSPTGSVQVLGSSVTNSAASQSSSISSSTSISIYVPTIQASSTTSGVSQSPFSSPNLNRNKSQIVRIVVGIIGAATLVAVIFWYFRRRRRRAGEQPSPLVDDGARMAEAAGQLDPDSHANSVLCACSNLLGQLTLAYIGLIILLFGVELEYFVTHQDPSDPSTFPPPIVFPPIPATQTTPSGENGQGAKSTSKNDRAEYSGLPLV